MHKLTWKENGEAKVPFVDGDAYSGITKREYFAGLAMQAMVTRADRREGWSEGEAEQCLYIADTLLEALSKP